MFISTVVLLFLSFLVYNAEGSNSHQPCSVRVLIETSIEGTNNLSPFQSKRVSKELLRKVEARIHKRFKRDMLISRDDISTNYTAQHVLASKNPSESVIIERINCVFDKELLGMQCLKETCTFVNPEVVQLQENKSDFAEEAIEIEFDDEPVDLSKNKAKASKNTFGKGIELVILVLAIIAHAYNLRRKMNKPDRAVADQEAEPNQQNEIEDNNIDEQNETAVELESEDETPCETESESEDSDDSFEII